MFLGLGVAVPFVMTLGYVWVDSFQPQTLVYFVLNELPVAMIMGVGAILSYFALDRRSPPPLMLPSVLTVIMALWMTMSLAWAELPDHAWTKWDPAFKAVMFAAFVPLVIRSRVQIEAFAQTFVFSLAANFVPFGMKVLLSGGGYGQNLGLQGGNSGLAEGGLLSTVCLMTVPLSLFLGKHGKLIPRLPMMGLAYAAVAFLAVVTAIGTYERSALVGLVILGGFMFIQSRRKMLTATIAGLGALILVAGMASSWESRISTITDYSKESSAMTRILVWKWTLDYVMTNPLGGSFDAFVINAIILPPEAGNDAGTIQFGRAYHSIYFEVLGELGWPGLFLFLTTAGTTLFSLWRLARKCRKIPELTWVADMSNAVQAGLMVFLSSGAFVGIAFQPPFWYFVSLGVCLRAFVWRAEREQAPEVSGWRLAALQAREATSVAAIEPRKPPILDGEEPLRVPAWRAGAHARRGR
jgi:probable O-glycosylation ligase (exosortase A-associated)